MKYTDIAKAALVLVLGVMTSTAFAANLYEETFEGPAANSAITNHAGWKGGADDVSKVVVTNTYTGTKLLADPHTKVLQLNTEGGVLTNDITDVSFSSAARYVDTLVKFVPSEDLPAFDAAGDIKVAVYAYVKEVQASPLITATNLAIYHGFYNDGDSVPTNTVTDLPVNPNSWYRLTIELANRSDYPAFQGFRILINGVPLTNDAAYATDDWSTLDQGATAPGDGTWFLSAANKGNVTVATVQFKGTGFIDDLAVTAEDPFPTGPTTYTVTQSIGGNGSGNNPNASFTVNVGSTTSLTYTAAEFYRIATLTTNGITVSGAIGNASATVVVSSANAVTSTFAIVSGYTAGNVSWFNANGWGEGDIVANALSYDTLQMLNVAPTNAAAGGTITIEAIEVVGDDVKVTVFIDRTMSIGANIVGTLKLYGAATLEGGFTAIGAGVTIGGDLDGTQDDIRKEITYVMAGGMKFYKAVIE